MGKKLVYLILMIYFLIFIIELIILFYLSRKLINSLARIFFRLTRNHQAVVNILAIIFLPGTILHELAHLLFAGIMLVPVGEINVLPVVEEAGVKLGSVQIGKTDPLRRIIVGVAPVLFGMLAILSVFYLIQGSDHFIWWQIVLALYLVFEIGNTMFSSKKDLEGTIGFVVAIAIVALVVLTILYFINPGILQNIWLYINKLNFGSVVGLFKSASIYLGIPIVLDILVITIARVVINIL